MSERVDYLGRTVVWQHTTARVFVHAAWVDGTWWVLRLNGFPDHPLFTLFVDGSCVGDVEDIQTRAPTWDLDVACRPGLTDEQRTEVLTLMRGLGPYGSEIDQPCDGDWCGCDRLTDEYVQGSDQDGSV